MSFTTNWRRWIGVVGYPREMAIRLSPRQTKVWKSLRRIGSHLCNLFGGHQRWSTICSRSEEVLLSCCLLSHEKQERNGKGFLLQVWLLGLSALTAGQDRCGILSFQIFCWTNFSKRTRKVLFRISKVKICSNIPNSRTSLPQYLVDGNGRKLSNSKHSVVLLMVGDRCEGLPRIFPSDFSFWMDEKGANCFDYPSC